MIARYNLTQRLLGVLCALGSMVCYIIAYFFFRYAAAFVNKVFSSNLHAWIPFHNPIQTIPGLEARLNDVLSRLNKMGRLDFSVVKTEPRFKAHPSP